MNETTATVAGLKALAGYFKITEVPAIEPVPGISLQLICAEKMMFSIVTIQPGAVVPLHSHFNEQIGTVLEGEMLFYMHTMNPEDGRRCGPGAFYTAPGGTPHAATSANDQPVVALDIFSPPREDYLELFRQKYGREVPGLTRE